MRTLGYLNKNSCEKLVYLFLFYHQKSRRKHWCYFTKGRVGWWHWSPPLIKFNVMFKLSLLFYRYSNKRL
jgi:hypothetical protein